jgi:GntR family histidine utilization transcriptional repressor
MTTLNQQIRNDIEDKILSGAWPPGHRIPNEHELMAHYGCARMTVNKALSELAAAGLIERRRKAGSFVRRPAEQSAVLEIPDIKGQIAAAGHVYDYQLLSEARHPGNVIILECRHLADGLPFALEQRRLMLDAIPEAAAADFTREPPGSWLLGHVPWHEAEHVITAHPADAAIAQALAVEEGSPCLVVDRRTWRSGQLVTSVRMWYPGGRYALTARFTPSGRG